MGSEDICPICGGNNWIAVAEDTKGRVFRIPEGRAPAMFFAENPTLRPAMAPCECQEQKRQRLRIKQILGQEDLPSEFGIFNFESFEELEYAQEALAYARQLAKGKIVNGDGVEKPGLLLTGPTGTGKTTLASVIAYSRMEQGQAIVWQDFNTLVRKIRRTYQPRYDGPDVDSIINIAAHAEFLVLDDLGSITRVYRDTELWAEDAIEAVRSIAHYRLQKQLPTVIPTNLSREQLYAQFGDRVMSRIRGLCHGSTMIGDDFRAPGDDRGKSK